MSVVVDNSNAMSWTLKDDGGLFSDFVLEQVIARGAHVPFIFRAEFANGRRMASRRGRIAPTARADGLVYLDTLEPIQDIQGTARLDVVLELADRHNLTVYDSIDLEVAQRMGLPLATFDKTLAKAAHDAGLALVALGS